MNRLDSQVMQESFNGLNETILKNRMLKQQQRDSDEQRADTATWRSELIRERNASLDSKAKIADTNANLKADAQTGLNDFRTKLVGIASQKADAGTAKVAGELKQHGIDAINKTFDIVGKYVADGSLSPETGTAMIKAAVGKVPPEFQTDPVIQMISQPDFKLSSPSNTAVEPLEKDFGGVKVIYNPKTGAFQKKDHAGSGMETVTREIPAQDEKPAVAASSGLFGWGAHPFKPKVEATDKETISFKRPMRSGAPGTVAAPTTGTNTPARPTRAKAKEYVDKYGKDAIPKLQADGFDTSGYAD